MHASHAIAAVALLALLPGCTIVHTKSGGPTRHHDKDCRSVAQCDVDVDPDNGVVPHKIRVSVRAATPVVWKIHPKSDWKWHWPRDVSFESDADGVVECRWFQHGPNRMCMKGRDTKAGEYKYTLFLYNSVTGVLLIHDPYLINE